MCQPCCDNIYIKYLEPDNTVDLNYLATLGTNVSVTHTPDLSRPDFNEWLISRGEQPPITTKINIDGDVKRFCMCECHRKDMNVCH